MLEIKFNCSLSVHYFAAIIPEQHENGFFPVNAILSVSKWVLRVWVLMLRLRWVLARVGFAVNYGRLCIQGILNGNGY